MNTVILQECTRFNGLIHVVHTSLQARARARAPAATDPSSSPRRD
jgi:hypothetical protein